MQMRLLAILLLALSAVRSHAQLTLNPGDVFTYEFSDLTYRQSVFGPAPEGLFQFTASSLDPLDAFRYEMFEGSLAADPAQGSLCSGLVTGPPAPGAWPCVVPGAWQDLQGTIRFTMLAGSVTLESFQLGVLRFGGPTGALWYSETITPVPEPGVLALFVLGAVGFLFRWCSRQHAATLSRRKQSVS